MEEDKIISELIKTLGKIKESNNITHSKILREAVNTNKIYTEILEQLKLQNKLLERAATDGRMVEIS